MNFKTIPFLLLSATMLSSCTDSCKRNTTPRPAAEQLAPEATGDAAQPTAADSNPEQAAADTASESAAAE